MRQAVWPPIVLSILACGVAAASARPESAPPCLATNLRPTLAFQGATSGLVGALILRNVGTRNCSLLGRSVVQLLGPGSRRLAGRQLPSLLPERPTPVRSLPSHGEAEVRLQWMNWCAGRPRAIVLTLPHGGGMVRVPVRDVPRCLGDGAPGLVVGPFEYLA